MLRARLRHPEARRRRRVAAAGDRACRLRRRRRRGLRYLRRGHDEPDARRRARRRRAPRPRRPRRRRRAADRTGDRRAPGHRCTPACRSTSATRRATRACTASRQAVGRRWFSVAAARRRLRPFANRGPAVRWLAPGDDLAYPFSPRRSSRFTPSRAEPPPSPPASCSCCSACNPELGLHEVHALLERTRGRTRRRRPRSQRRWPIPPMCCRSGSRPRRTRRQVRLRSSQRDPRVRSRGRPRGAGARRDGRGRRWRSPGALSPARPYSEALGRWAARALLARPDSSTRSGRCYGTSASCRPGPQRGRAHAPGALARQLSARRS